MVQTERETGVLRGQFARQAAVQVSAAAQAESARAQAEQLSRKLAAARAEVRRYQTRMFPGAAHQFTVHDLREAGFGKFEGRPVMAMRLTGLFFISSAHRI